ncbi:biotin-dependent carboxyltransferase family protein [Aeribacillus pallidus]|uniref:5-oxoprolinase subunit C family protein n=1 Tax=Aeribacillus TaxID=1055323 RepID=UPI0007B476D4|nr:MULTISPECIES: biotin-dependent carboxyltransferase family protein [Aeribacillus]KZM55508.1 allophanate hydrolase [Aeribacillus pallidus]MED0651979.1 biotin-dependent carboxyltransferase family protein [Aeribacillus composti]MED4486754.1 biotin-dependent carboxyltransferase family protein [Aeribacillus pallidus]
MIKVITPGLQTTIQDNGRIGYYEVGMPPSGAMDKYSYIVGNLLVGNNENAAALEITYMGPTLEFQEDAIIALTGGEIPPKINGQSVPMWEALAVKAGDQLSFDFVKNGARVYLAVAGGFDVPLVMGSRSTYTLCGIGGLDGRQLQENDILKIGNENIRPAKIGARIDDSFIPQFSNQHEIRVVLGLCSYRLTEESKERFFSIDWTVSTEANRVGYRFRGERLNFVERKQPFGAGSNPSNVVDLGYPIGSIQVPDGIEPIALLNDAVTGGGYATIGTIISADLNKLAQVKTNESVRFVAVDIEEALSARKEIKNKINQIKQQLC